MASEPESSDESLIFSTTSTAKPDSEPASLTDEAERILNSVPDHIGDDLDDLPADAGTLPGLQPQADVPQLGSPIMTEKNAASILRGIGETLATWRKREAYKNAGERAAEDCADSLAQVANQAWAQLAPSFLKSMESSCPGVVPLCMGLAFAFGPAVMEDIRESGAERMKRGLTEERRPRAPEPEPEAAQPGPGGLTAKKARAA
jgi:hypothetical protein